MKRLKEKRPALAENPAKLVAAAFVKLRELTERGGKG